MISMLIYIIVSFIMMGIGVSQLKSKEPVGFYSGVKPPDADELSDVSGWNKKHGMMWIIYGIIITLSWILGIIIGDSIYSVIIMCGGSIIPIVVMIWYHHRLIKRYKK